MKQTLQAALQARGYTSLTPVQEAVSKPELAGRDLLVSAQTGSGKTVGFGLAIAPSIMGEADEFGHAGAPLALIIAPTRELALQVRHELSWLYHETGVRMASCVGGMDARSERRALEKGAHIVVATPGRLCDHLRRGAIDLSALRAVVLDEADEMLDMGFREDLEAILDAAPEDRQTLLFSATVSPDIARLATRYQHDAQRISTQAPGGQHKDISYHAVLVAEHDQENAITNLLRFHEAPNAIVFANTRAAVARLVSRLSNRGFSVVSLSGELSQAERSHALQSMRDGRARICVATDVAARGIDLPNLDLVIHAELPQSEEAMLHRSGRTGRAGRKGISALIVPPRARRKAERMLRAAKLEAIWEPAPSAEAVLARDEERMLADPVWNEPANDTETDAVAQILAQRGPEAAALAMLRLWRGLRSAPEDLSDAPDRPDQAPAFGPSRWFSLPIGRDRNASPKWLMPKICEAGDITRAEIGAIRITDEESFVEISAAAVDGFLDAIGPQLEIAPELSMTLLDAPPKGLAQGRKAPGKGRFARAPRSEDGHRGWSGKKSGPRRDDSEGGYSKGGDRGFDKGYDKAPGGKPKAKYAGKKDAKPGWAKPARAKGKPKKG